MKRGTAAGLVTGLLALTLLEAFLSGPQSTNVGGMLRGIGDLARKWADPAVPAIPDLRTGKAPSSDGLVHHYYQQPASSSTSSRLPSTVPA